MHIPDGYLSPSTCAGLYAASAPFWYVALRRVRRVLHTRTVPLLSVFSAFSFAVMMFNLPLPGGTTGHAVGMAIAAIVLGPWFALLAISTALLIQALLFGDGGVTAFGANCFNMAIVGSLAAYVVYRVVAYRAALTSLRRVFAAGLAGYVAINLSALCAAVEFGLQPRYFHDAAGAPLYAPYPLHIAIPAMMLGHLTFAGLAELVLSAGLIAYLQRADVALLRTTAPDAPEEDDATLLPAETGFDWPSARKLWLILGLVLLLTPLGILAGGTAWGEWRPQDFGDPSARQSIAAVSGRQAPPPHAPSGLAKWSTIWTAPLANYAPSFVRNSQAGYFISALAGVGAIILLVACAAPLAAKMRPRSRVRPSFVEKSIRSIMRASEDALYAEGVAQSKGFLQRLDPRVKLVGIGALVFTAIAIHRLPLACALLACSGVLALWSRVPLRSLVHMWLAVLMFTGVIALPAVFLTRGVVIVHVPMLGWPVSSQGIAAAAFLLIRAETASTLVLALVLTTPWIRLLRALRAIGVPATFVVVLQMTYRYIFVFLQGARDLFESRRARLLGPPDASRQRNTASSIAGALLAKSLALSNDVHLAMQARGFRGEVHLLDDLAMRRPDWVHSAVFVTVAALLIWYGR